MNSATGDRMFVAVMPTVIVCIAVMNLLSTDLAITLVKENGPVETLSAAGYLFAAFLLFLEVWRGRMRDGFSAGLLVTMLGLRELDFHTRFTTMGIFKTRYYISDQVPGGEKIIGFLIVMLIFVVAIRYGKRNIIPFWNALRSDRMYAITLGLSLGCIVASKMLDSFSWPFEPLAACFSNEPKHFLRVAEESLELAIPLYLLLSIHYFTHLGGDSKQCVNKKQFLPSTFM